jgi:tetratricopeptide (TPR) repeat protein
MGKAADWDFAKRFRRGGFGWRASSLASDRIAEALSEIHAVARHDPLHAADGAVRFLVKLSPALEQVDGSSGALGGAARAAVDSLVPVIAQAPADEAMREKWLEQLFEAIQNDDPPYVELLDERWGDLCATPEVASLWADRLMGLVQHVHADRRCGQYAFTRAECACYSALFAAGRHEELVALIGGDPRPMWRDLLWVGRCKVARGEIDEAIEFMAKAVNPWMPMAGLAHFAEGVLLHAGRRTEAYEKYALEANRATTYLATYRLVSKKYPEIDADRLLTDLIATTPGEEGKWFATARTLKRLDLAMQLAWKSPCDPKTLVRAARDNVGKNPAFAAEVALSALHWICQGRGYELTSLDVQMAYRLASEAGQALGQSERVALRIQTMLKPATREVRWVREMLNMPALSESDPL